MTTAATCATCGSSFTPPAELLERFPGWTPPECPDCFGRGRRRSASAPAARRVEHDERSLLDEVLARHKGGPDTGVFTDGGASPNPGPGGWAAVYVVDGVIVAQASGHEPQTTNNRMELTAILEGIQLVPEGTRATIYSDSNLAVRTVNEWAPGWRARGWRRKSGPVENLDLVRPLCERLDDRPELDLAWIQAHAGNRWNEYADALATAYQRETL